MARKEGVLQFWTRWDDGDVFATLLYKEGQRYVFGATYVPPAAVQNYDDEDGGDNVDDKSAALEQLNEEFVFCDFPFVQAPRPHCEILCRYGYFNLRDLKTDDTGTFLNGKKLNTSRSRRLVTGDIVSMGIGPEHGLEVEKKTGRGREAVVKKFPLVQEEGLILDIPVFRFIVKGSENGTTIKWDLRKGQTHNESSSSCFGGQEYSATSSALNNPSILEEILKYLTVDDLKMARLVSKDWNTEIVKTLAKKSCVKFLYPVGVGYKRPQVSMRMFNYLNRMQYFYNRTVMIKIWNRRGDDFFDKIAWDVTRLLSATRNHIQFLELQTDDGDIPFHGVIHFPKLKAVTFHKNTSSFSTDDEYPDYESLEEQETRVKNFVLSVTTATSMSLKAQSNFTEIFLRYLSASSLELNPSIVLPNLTELELCSKMPYPTEVLKCLAQVSRKLKMVCLGGEVEIGEQDNVVAFEEFLYNQAPTLEEIRMVFRGPNERVNLALNFPSFPKLKFFYAEFLQFVPTILFPGPRFSTKKLYKLHFPVIECVRMTADSCVPIYSVFCAPEITLLDSCPTMKEFNVHGDRFKSLHPKEVSYWTKRISEVFPNLDKSKSTKESLFLLTQCRQLGCHCFHSTTFTYPLITL